MNTPSKYADRIKWILPFALCLMVGCSLLQQRRRNPECKTLFEQIEHGWFRDTVLGLYHLKPEALAGNRIGSFHDDECLIGLAQKDVERLFGKPDTVRSGRMVYYMSEPCLEKGFTKTIGCYSMGIGFDAEGGLRSIGMTYSGGKLDYIDPNPAPDKGK